MRARDSGNESSGEGSQAAIPSAQTSPRPRGRHPRKPPWANGLWEQGPWVQGSWQQGQPPWANRPDGERRHAPAVIAAFVVAMIQVIGCTIAMDGQSRATPLDLLGYALLVIGPVALAARRRRPLLTLVVTLAATVTYLALDYPRGPFFLAAVVALFGAVRRANRTACWALLALAYLAYVVVGSASVGTYLVTAVGTVVAMVLAQLNRLRGDFFAQVATTRAEASRARQEQSRRQASDERLRIARELHDVLGHHLSLINVRAGVGLHLLDSDPDQAREALGAIKVASAEALREVRGVLSTLNPQPGDAPRSPAPNLADLDALAEETRAAGRAVTVDHTGDPVPVPGDVGRAAYRIVQEALTNVRRHAGPAASASITIGYRPDALTVRVEDTGPGPASSTSDGNGIPGMRERAAALGGTLTATGHPEGGFRVDARLPLTRPPLTGPPLTPMSLTQENP